VLFLPAFRVVVNDHCHDWGIPTTIYEGGVLYILMEQRKGNNKKSPSI
jgi:hypothetical protein